MGGPRKGGGRGPLASRIPAKRVPIDCNLAASVSPLRKAQQSGDRTRCLPRYSGTRGTRGGDRRDGVDGLSWPGAGRPDRMRSCSDSFAVTVANHCIFCGSISTSSISSHRSNCARMRPILFCRYSSGESLCWCSALLRSSMVRSRSLMRSAIRPLACVARSAIWRAFSLVKCGRPIETNAMPPRLAFQGPGEVTGPPDTQSPSESILATLRGNLDSGMQSRAMGHFNRSMMRPILNCNAPVRFQAASRSSLSCSSCV
jgi:hypothetical protein